MNVIYLVLVKTRTYIEFLLFVHYDECVCYHEIKCYAKWARGVILGHLDNMILTSKS